MGFGPCCRRWGSVSIDEMTEEELAALIDGASEDEPTNELTDPQAAAEEHTVLTGPSLLRKVGL